MKAKSALFLAMVLLAAATLSQAAGKIDPAIYQKLEEGEDLVRVIVHVVASPDAFEKLPPRGQEIPKKRLEAVSKAVDESIAEIRGNIKDGKLKIIHKYQLYPAWAAEVDSSVLNLLEQSPRVRLVELDRIYTMHTKEGIPLIGGDVAQSLGYDGTGTAVAIIDTGVDYNHPALGGGSIPNSKVVYGKDTADNDDDPMDCDVRDSHGTAVASIAAGYPYEYTVIRKFYGGVAQGAKILAYKATQDQYCGSFATSDVVAAIEDAIQQRDNYNVVAINLSLGGGLYGAPCDNRMGNSLYSAAIRNATDAGIAVVVSSGNEAAKSQLASPACVIDAISVGSAYDEDIGFPGYAYCANESCTQTLCTDSNVPVKTPTCYSNSNYYLDVLAPSEELTAAGRGAQIQHFGGTSGAAPYVTGAVAVLAQAFPDYGPAQWRALLEISGEPIEDPANGVSRPLINLANAIQGTSWAVPSETRLEIESGGTVSSSAYVDLDGYVDSVRVMVKISHSRPQDLVVTLISPDGTRVKLHDHGVGTNMEGTTDATFGSNGIYAYYPDDRAPAESLDGFKGLPARGSWTLEVKDTGSAKLVIKPMLVTWALEVHTGTVPEPPTSVDFILPVAVHASGAMGTFWVTDVRLFNPSYTSGASAKLYFIEAGNDGTQQFSMTNVNVAPKSVVALSDIISDRFSVEGAQGNLLFQLEEGSLLATSRTYNTGGGNGTYGQFIDMVDPSNALAQGGGKAYLVHLANDSRFRTNIGFSELSGAAATVTVKLYDCQSNQVGQTATYEIKPYSNVQVNRVFEAQSAGSCSCGYAELEVSGAGKVVAYASVVDNSTGDAIYIPAAKPLAGPQILPISAKKAGAAGTNWVTDVRLFNPGSNDLAVTLEYKPEASAGGSEASVEVTVPAGSVLALDDVLGSTFGLSDASGSIRIVPVEQNAQMVVTSRTYNDTGAGTYGQFIPAVGNGFASGQNAVIFFLEKSSAYRSNVGVCEVSGEPVSVRLALKDAGGNTLGTYTLDLAPYQVRQLNDVFGVMGAPAQEVARLDIFHNGGEGQFVAYASVVDNATGDAVYISARPLD